MRIDQPPSFRIADRWSLAAFCAALLLEGCHWHLFLTGPVQTGVGWAFMAAGSCYVAVGSLFYISASFRAGSAVLSCRPTLWVGLGLLFLGSLLQFTAGVAANSRGRTLATIASPRARLVLPSTLS